MNLQKWQKLSAVPALILSLIYTFAFIYPIYWYPVSPTTSNACRSVEYVIWALFAVDYFYQFGLSKQKGEYFQSHILELLLVILPVFRPLRALRALLFATRAAFRNITALIRFVPAFIATAAALMIVVMGAAVLDVERFAPGANINSPQKALWWAFTTITTIAYGDVYPVTSEGHLITVVLVVFGVASISTLTATFAAWILDLTKSHHHSEK